MKPIPQSLLEALLWNGEGEPPKWTHNIPCEKGDPMRAIVTREEHLDAVEAKAQYEQVIAARMAKAKARAGAADGIRASMCEQRSAFDNTPAPVQ